ncbi:hypothetical protein [Streptomyces sp. Wb2n-11]|uniref:hypothetical protein n=1 Tax=Streptomyces sp. Wb2n-11 TaxID=1030533 RepID=UPI000B895683|nr:hypothetical protein [Streptomyces sp. Wb2n-11]
MEDDAAVVDEDVPVLEDLAGGGFEAFEAFEFGVEAFVLLLPVDGRFGGFLVAVLLEGADEVFACGAGTAVSEVEDLGSSKGTPLRRRRMSMVRRSEMRACCALEIGMAVGAPACWSVRPRAYLDDP